MTLERDKAHAIAPLQAADWRFVLPAYAGGGLRRLVLLGGVEGLAERIVEIGLASSVVNTLPADAGADAIVVLHNSTATLEAAAACLTPGGVLYYEIARDRLHTIRSTPRAIERRLRSAGLTPAGSYAIGPHPSGPMLYLPLDAQGALRWYVTTVFNPTTPARRLVELGLIASMRITREHIFSALPFFAVTAIAGTGEARPTSVLAHAPVRDLLPPGDLYPLVLADAGNRVVILPFTRNSSKPAAVLKVPKLPVFNGRTRNEQRTLTEVRGGLGPALRRTVPEPLGLVDWQGVAIGVESYTDGQPLKRSSGRWGTPPRRKISDLRLAAAWLAEFHSQIRIRSGTWGAREIDEWVSRPFRDYEQAFTTTPAEAELFDACRARAASLLGAPYSTVWHHRDFNVWNILRYKDEARIIDWESGRPGPPLCDLLRFSMHWHETVRGRRGLAAALDGLRSLFLEPDSEDEIRDAIHSEITRYMRRLDLDPRFTPLLLTYTWVEVTLRRRTQQLDHGIAEGDARSGNWNLAFVALLAEHRKALFGMVDGATVAARGEAASVSAR